MAGDDGKKKRREREAADGAAGADFPLVPRGVLPGMR